MQTTDQYRLIFEGPQDDSDETLRNLKGTFIAELEFSVEKAKEIFENTPYQILSATSEGELQSLYNLIQAAGGRVLIARPQTTDDHEEEFEFTFDMEEAEPQQQMKEKKDTPAPVYNLEFDPEDDPTEDEMVKELLAEGDAESKSAMEEKKAEDPLGLSGLSFDEPDHGPNNIIIPEEEPEPHAISLNFDTGETSTELLEEKKQAAPLSGIIEPTSSIDSLGLTFDEPDHEEEEKATSSIIDAEESALEEEESIVPLSESLLMDEGSEEKPEVFLEQDTELREEIELSPPVQELKEVPVSSSLTVESETEESISVESAESKPIPTPKKEVQENTPSAPQTTTTIEEHEHAKYQTKIEQPITNEFSESFDPKSERETRNKQAIIIGIVALLLVGNGYFIYSNFLAGDDLASSEEAIHSIIESAAKASKKAALIEQKETKKKAKDKTVSYQFEEIKGATPFTYGEVSWELTVRGPQLVSGSMRLTTPRPRDRTSAEIVRGMKPIPWLTKAEIHSLKFLPIEGDQYKSSGVAKLYLEDAGKRHRVVVPVTILASYKPETKVLEGQIELENDFEGTKREEVFVLEKLKGNAYSLYLHSFFSNRSPEEQLSGNAGETPSLHLPPVEHAAPEEPKPKLIEKEEPKTEIAPPPSDEKKDPVDQWGEIAGLETLF